MQAYTLKDLGWTTHVDFQSMETSVLLRRQFEYALMTSYKVTKGS
jgi:hypothetical protein